MRASGKCSGAAFTGAPPGSRRAVLALILGLAGPALGGARPPITARLALWLRADAGMAMAKGTDLVTAWADQTPKAARIAKPPSDAARPRLAQDALHGKPVVRFDGKDDRLDFKLPINGLEQLTIFMVAANTASQQPGWAAHQHLAFGWGYTGGWGIYGLSPLQETVAARLATATPFAAAIHSRPASIGAAFSVTALRKNGTHHAIFVNGQKVWSCINATPRIVNTSAAGAVGGGIFGAPPGAGFYQGDIAEILVYTAALTGADRKAVERYLAEKWLRPSRPRPEIVRQPIRKPTGQWTGWWRFDGDFQDSSGKGNHAAKPEKRGNDARIVTDPVRGQVLEVDGDGDYLRVTSSPTIDLNSSFTLALWVKFARPLKAQRPWAGIVGKGSLYGSQFAILVDGNPRKDYLQGEFYYGHYPNVHYATTRGLVPNTRDWYHVALVLDDSADTLTLYVNGKAAGAVAARFNPATTRGWLELGRYPGRPGQSFAGRLDDVRLYDKALSGQQISGLAKPTPGRAAPNRRTPDIAPRSAASR